MEVVKYVYGNYEDETIELNSYIPLLTVEQWLSALSLAIVVTHYGILFIGGINSNVCLLLRYVCDTVRYGVPACKEFTLYLNGLRQKTNC